MKRVTILLLAAFAAAPLGQPAWAQRATGELLSINLVCRGTGEIHRMVPNPDKDKKKSGYNPSMIMRRTPFDGTVQLRLRPGKGEAMVPPAMVGEYGERGWKEVSKLAITSDAIDGKVELALLYAPRMHVDRTTGTIQITGTQSDFNGQCRPYDPSQRAF